MCLQLNEYYEIVDQEVEWQTTRIEATATTGDEDFLTPLRLIANQAKIRIVLKKRLSGL